MNKPKIYIYISICMFILTNIHTHTHKYIFIYIYIYKVSKVADNSQGWPECSLFRCKRGHSSIPWIASSLGAWYWLIFNSLCWFMANQVQYNLESVQYLRESYYIIMINKYILDFIYLMPWKFVCDLWLHEVLQTTIVRLIMKGNE